MRIGDRENRPVGPEAVRSAKGAGKQPPSPTAASPSPQTPPSEGSELLGRLRSVPEIRSDIVDEVERRMKQGDLLTRQAAEQTAEAILAQIAGSIYSDSEI